MATSPFKTLVTGGAGFIGSHVVDLLVAQGHRVVILDDLSTGRREYIHPDTEFIQVDISSPRVKGVIERHDLDAVIHLAAQPAVAPSIQDPLFDCRVNILGTLNLLGSCARNKVRRFVYASTAAVYGEPGQLPLTESAPTCPRSPYGLSKLTAERYLRLYHDLFGLETVTLRYGNVYGPRQSTIGEAGVICLFITQMLRGEQPVIHGDGLQTRDFVYVSDIARANLMALSPDAPPGVYNVSTGVGTAIASVFDALAGGRFARFHGEPRPGDVRHSALDPTAIRRTMGWQPTVPLSDGLAFTEEFFQKAV